MASEHVTKMLDTRSHRERAFTLRGRPTPPGTAVIEMDDDQGRRGRGQAATLLRRWQEREMVWPLWKVVRQLLQRLNTVNTLPGHVPSRGRHPGELGTRARTETCARTLAAASFSAAPECSRPEDG